jgi:hypothetical protein
MIFTFVIEMLVLSYFPQTSSQTGASDQLEIPTAMKSAAGIHSRR